MPGVTNTILKPNLPITILLSLCLSVNAFAQEKGFYISGRVTDALNGEPVENANISIQNTTTGTSTNELGEFVVWISHLPFIVEISHVTYETKTLQYGHQPLQPLKISVNPRTEPLSEVVITSRRIDTVYADRIYSVLDYELCDRGILLLIYKARLSRSELLLQDYSGNTLLELKILPMKPLSLYRDCLGEIHILSEDKAYQVSIQETSMELYPPYDINFFAEVMAGCKFKIGHKVYFEDVQFFELVKKFYYVNTTDTTSHLLAVATDQEKIEFLRQNPENYNINTRDLDLNLLEGMKGLPSDQQNLSKIRDIDVTLRFNKMAYLSRIYAPFYPMNDSVVIFNHPAGVIQFFNLSDSLVAETPITYQETDADDIHSTLVYGFAKRTKWLEQVFVDETDNKAYTLFQNINGTMDLKEINLETGKLAFKLNIPFPYVQKIKLRGGFVYFVYKGYGESPKKKLFRQKVN